MHRPATHSWKVELTWASKESANPLRLERALKLMPKSENRDQYDQKREEHQNIFSFPPRVRIIHTFLESRIVRQWRNCGLATSSRKQTCHSCLSDPIHARFSQC